MKSFIIIAALLVASAAHDARAQGFLNPYVDTTLTSPSATGNSTEAGLGIALGSVGKIVGFETDIAYHPEVIDNSANALAKSHVFTFSGNFLIGPRIGTVKPYVALGVGDLMLNVSRLSTLVIPNPESISNNYFTVNLGGGVIGFFAAHFGLRGDLRYFRAYGFKITDLQTAGISLDRFDFWRASGGVVVGF